jgi:predicted RNase H-like nuclease
LVWVRALGLDGFARGWVAVLLDGEISELSFHPDITDALRQPFDRAGIDIPVGMPDDGTRDCDLLARERLRPHASRVFTGARRWLWQAFDDPDKANTEATRRGQSRASRQLWHLGTKIMQVDAYIRANASLDIREVHPELVFLRLNRDRPLPSKKSAEGLSLRQRLLRRAGFPDIAEWTTRMRLGTGAKPDDVLDACAVAIAAREPVGSLPEGAPPVDGCGVKMQIWF